jgi:hypothetical protein
MPMTTALCTMSVCASLTSPTHIHSGTSSTFAVMRARRTQRCCQVRRREAAHDGTVRALAHLVASEGMHGSEAAERVQETVPATDTVLDASAELPA